MAEGDSLDDVTCPLTSTVPRHGVMTAIMAGNWRWACTPHCVGVITGADMSAGLQCTVKIGLKELCTSSAKHPAWRQILALVSLEQQQ